MSVILFSCHNSDGWVDKWMDEGSFSCFWKKSVQFF